MKNDFIKFDQESHTYHDINGIEYKSVSKLLSGLSKPFDAKKIAPFVAKKRDKDSKAMALQLKISQAEVIATYPIYKRGITTEEVLQEWDDVRNSSTDVGHRIHNALEKYAISTKVDPENVSLKEMIIAVNSLFCEYSKVFQEMVFHSAKYRIAGTADKPCFRTRKIDGTLDIFDYKTNESRGIEYESKYGDYMANPLDHLEDCNYNKYVMQLSIYGVMAQEMFNCKIGKLALIFIPPTDPNNFRVIPVPYMKHEAIALMKTNVTESDYEVKLVNEEKVLNLDRKYSDSNYIPKFK
jgi:hypothetical protein